MSDLQLVFWEVRALTVSLSERPRPRNHSDLNSSLSDSGNLVGYLVSRMSGVSPHVIGGVSEPTL